MTINAPVLKQIKQSNPIRNRSLILTECMDRRILKSLFLIGKIDRAKSATTLTNARVKKWFNDSIKEKPKDVTERIHSAVSSIKFEFDRTDPAGSDLTFTVDFGAALNGQQHLRCS